MMSLEGTLSAENRENNEPEKVIDICICYKGRNLVKSGKMMQHFISKKTLIY